MVHMKGIQNYTARVIFHLPKSSNIITQIQSLHWLPVKVRSTYKIVCATTATAVLHHHMSLTCCIECFRTLATFAPAHTPCLFSMDLYTVGQHLGIASFLLLLPLSGTLFQMISAVPHHRHHLCLAWGHSWIAQFTNTELSLRSLYICAFLALVIPLLMAFLKKMHLCV